MKTKVSEYCLGLTIGDQVLYKCEGQVYLNAVERASTDFVWVDGYCFNRHTGVENTVPGHDEVDIKDCAVIMLPSPEAMETFEKHKKRRMTSVQIKRVAGTGLMSTMGEDCRGFLCRCYKIFEEKLAAEEGKPPMTESDVTKKSLSDLVGFVKWGIDQDMIEECSLSHAEFVERVINQKAAMLYVQVCDEEQGRGRVAPGGDRRSW